MLIDLQPLSKVSEDLKSYPKISLLQKEKERILLNDNVVFFIFGYVVQI